MLWQSIVPGNYDINFICMELAGNYKELMNNLATHRLTSYIFPPPRTHQNFCLLRHIICYLLLLLWHIEFYRACLVWKNKLIMLFLSPSTWQVRLSQGKDFIFFMRYISRAVYCEWRVYMHAYMHAGWRSWEPI